MAINELHLQNFRNLKTHKLTFNSHLNIICGDNGSGKTSLLEAIYSLSTTKSFRTQHLKTCINHDKNEFILFGLFDNHKVGLKKTVTETVFKLDGSIAKNRSSIARLQPSLILNADSFDLISGTPQIKRELLDWTLFHVKHDFGTLWNQYRVILKQRNQLLKNNNLKEINYWDPFLIKFNQQIHLYRVDLVKELFKKLKVNKIFNELNFEYYPGWKIGKTFSQCLEEKKEIDLKRGFTSVGVHKSYFEIFSDNKNVKNFLSRGQIKNLFIQINIALLNLLKKDIHQSVFIIDDLSAELDKNSIKNVIVSLLDNDHQVFISNIEYEDYLKEIDCNKTVFHVKHGDIKIQQ